MMRQRLASMACRSATSVRRVAVRASSKPATLAQAISSTTPKAPLQHHQPSRVIAGGLAGVAKAPCDRAKRLHLCTKASMTHRIAFRELDTECVDLGLRFLNGSTPSLASQSPCCRRRGFELEPSWTQNGRKNSIWQKKSKWCGTRCRRSLGADSGPSYIPRMTCRLRSCSRI